DRITSRRINRVTTGQIYWGVVPFVIIQVVMVGLIIAFPHIVSRGGNTGPTVDVDKAFQQMQQGADPGAPAAAPAPALPDSASAPGASGSEPELPTPESPQDPAQQSDDAAMKQLLESM